MLPLYLTLRETQLLTMSVAVLQWLDGEVLTNDELALSAEQRDLGRADQVRAAARDRRGELQSLHTALHEHATSIERSP